LRNLLVASIKFKLFTLTHSIPKQAKLIEKTKWNHLIILDACRYDFFEQEIFNFLDGKLRQTLSSASRTDHWLKKTWTKTYNLIYFSACPIVNSRKVSIKGFLATQHFHKILDIWDFGWDAKLSTVTPWNVNKTVRKFKPAKSIIHYLQPHGPWIGKTKLTLANQGFQSIKHPIMADTLIAEKIRKGEITLQRLKQAYRDNLRLALKYVGELVPILSGKIVITSDHGELLGEHGFLLHPQKLRAIELRVVPWFEIK